MVNESLDRFMMDVLIPLACQTNAVIICMGVVGNLPACGLATSFTRAMSLMKSKWRGSPPFTVIGCVPELCGFYENPDANATWREIRASSKAWTARHKRLCELSAEKQTKSLSDPKRANEHQAYMDRLKSGKELKTDMDPNGTNFLVVDTSSDSEFRPPNYKVRQEGASIPRWVLSPSLALHTRTCLPALPILSFLPFVPASATLQSIGQRASPPPLFYAPFALSKNVPVRRHPTRCGLLLRPGGAARLTAGGHARSLPRLP